MQLKKAEFCLPLLTHPYIKTLWTLSTPYLQLRSRCQHLSCFLHQRELSPNDISGRWNSWTTSGNGSTYKAYSVFLCERAASRRYKVDETGLVFWNKKKEQSRINTNAAGDVWSEKFTVGLTLIHLTPSYTFLGTDNILKTIRFHVQANWQFFFFWKVLKILKTLWTKVRIYTSELYKLRKQTLNPEMPRWNLFIAWKRDVLKHVRISTNFSLH